MPTNPGEVSRAGEVRIERDSMGEVEVPAAALWGASTQRAILNFPVSGEKMPLRLIHALGLVKAAAAAANRELGALDEARARAIEQAAREVAEGRHDAQFVLDVFQTGSGTSTNTNANEVIARLAERSLGPQVGGVHPNDHVNRSQSSNDVMPTALHVAGRLAIQQELLPALRRLHDCLARKAAACDDVVKIGRTHLMDATPLRLSQELGGWARQVELGVQRAEAAGEALAELALGGTAVGTGLNRPVGFPERAIADLERATGVRFREAADHFEAQAARDGAVEASGALRTIAVSLFKIASDLRLLASGPRCGLGELRLPALQPGSSIMPGKVNPVICESVTQVAAQVIGHDAAIAVAGLSGQLQLNAFLPLIARNLLESVRLLANVSNLFVERCLEGLEVDRQRAGAWVEGSLALVTALVPAIGYDAAARIAKRCAETGKTVREVCLEQRVLPRDQLERLLDPRAQTEPGGAS
jgi:fumarate hydratase class II